MKNKMKSILAVGVLVLGMGTGAYASDGPVVMPRTNTNSSYSRNYNMGRMNNSRNYNMGEMHNRTSRYSNGSRMNSNVRVSDQRRGCGSRMVY